MESYKSQCHLRIDSTPPESILVPSTYTIAYMKTIYSLYEKILLYLSFSCYRNRLYINTYAISVSL